MLKNIAKAIAFQRLYNHYAVLLRYYLIGKWVNRVHYLYTAIVQILPPDVSEKCRLPFLIGILSEGVQLSLSEV